VCVCACAVFARSDVCSLTQAALPRVPSVTARLRRALAGGKSSIFLSGPSFFSRGLWKDIFRDAN
jgi:hypothetical protein